jgi:HTH-type transcriptional regulator/antitoxin HigA
MNPEPDDYLTPGQLIRALAEQRGWSNRLLAIILDMDETGLNKIVAGKRDVGAELALALGEVFGEPPERFMALQARYGLAQAKLRVKPDPGRGTRAKVFGGLPVAEMIRRGWLDAEDVRDVPTVEKALVKFFGVSALAEIEAFPHAAKRVGAPGGVTLAQIGWLHRVKTIASDMMAAPYSPNSVREALPRLRALTSSVEETRKVSRIMAEAGIRYVIVESLPSAKIDGVCFWLDERTPVVGMTLRHDRIDNFWFVLRHELEHVLHLHGQTEAMLDTELEGDRAGFGSDIVEEERIANEAAANFCIPQKTLDSFIARKSPFFAERDVLSFARLHQVHPGIIAGQLSHRTGRYDRFRAHLVKVRSVVAPGTMVDGWGDVAPTET